MKLAAMITTLLISVNAFSATYNCEVWKGGFDPEAQQNFAGTMSSAPNIIKWSNSLGEYEITLTDSLIAFTKIRSNSMTTVYTATIAGKGKYEGSFWAENFTDNNLITYRCAIN
ncbi:hypothetical protein D3C87_1670710 [compost metagenome]